MNPIEELRPKAEAGDAQAQLDIALAYQDPVGCRQDYVRAVEWLQKAAVQGLSEAQYELALKYQFGMGVESNCAEAIYWFSKAAEAGNTSAANQLGWMFLRSKDVEKNPAAAMKWFRKAADLGCVPAHFNLATLYSGDLGPDQKDEAEAVKWYRKAGDQGHDAAQYALGGMYAEGRGVPKDESKAVEWFRKAAAQGYAAAHSNLKRFTSPTSLEGIMNSSGPVAEDLESAITKSHSRLRILKILRAETAGSSLHLTVLLAPFNESSDLREIVCFNAADYSIRPSNPAIIEGGPAIELHSSHPLLEEQRLQLVPGGDGEVFRPPLKLKLLILDQSHVIAERFEHRKCPNHSPSQRLRQ